MAIERIEIRIPVQREHGFNGIDPSPLRKIELLLTSDGVQYELQVGCRREFVLGQLSDDLERDPCRHFRAQQVHVHHVDVHGQIVGACRRDLQGRGTTPGLVEI